MTGGAGFEPVTGFEPVATLTVDPGTARIHAEGWQSWSVTDSLPVTAVPYRPTLANSLAMDCHYNAAPPEGVFQGEGVLAVDPGDGGPVHVFAADRADRTVPRVRAEPAPGGVLRISSDAPVLQLEGEDGATVQSALGAWADGFARRARVSEERLTRAAPTVWCSWYQYWNTVTEADIHAELDAMDELDLPFGVVQIDDGYQAAPGDWLLPSDRFADLPGLVGRISGHGRRAGIWTAPLLLGLGSRLYAEHPDWAVIDPASGEPVFAGDAIGDRCTALDVTNPAAAAYLSGVFEAMRGWGIAYFKIDFMYAAALEGRRYADVTGVEAYREALRIIRDAIGPDSYLVGCGAPLLPAAGFVDAMRVGPDIAAYWQAPGGHPSEPSQHNATRNVRARAWQHGRLWTNDPDCLMLRPGVERREEWARTVETHGGLRSSGDGLRALDDWGLATTRRLLWPS
ncbi:glycoside hydrolase family 36 protein [Streptomyces himalayensis]|uniref:glycoside hydrolase family 36 protein n=1 Tax=Streptomyces himalayensis TaxID=2820085 RepID=UPI002867DCB0|nr:alpha-galactosidase [Streptomyces himalayensis]